MARSMNFFLGLYEAGIMQLGYIRMWRVSPGGVPGLRCGRTWFFLKNFAGEGKNFVERITPGVARQAGFAAGFLEKFFTREMMLGGDLREQQASPVFAGNDQTVFADFDVLGIDLRNWG